jgi:exo-1,4-beta-D-glucosaminidase
MSSSDLASLWQNPKANQYHANYESRCTTGYSFGTPCHFNAALDARYGTPSSLTQYVEDAQLQNYEDTRAQFEAFIDHASNSPLPSTGTIYWQMNKGWPSLLWYLYNNDGDQAGAYFGVQEADTTVHALYALDNGAVTLDNLSNATQSGLTIESKVYNLAGTVTDDQTSPAETLTSQQVQTSVLTPKVPTTPAGTTYFVELLLRRGGTVIDRNVYWLSTTPDVVNWSKSLGQPVGTVSTYANLTGLHSLPTSAISAAATSALQPGPDGADTATTVTVTNTSSSTVAFFLRADVRRGTAAGGLQSGDNELQSSIWQGNDITLFPGESQTLTVTYDSVDLNGATPVVTVSGWNVGQVNIPAPVP